MRTVAATVTSHVLTTVSRAATFATDTITIAVLIMIVAIAVGYQV